MSPVDSFVLTRLSPSEPPGRVSVLDRDAGVGGLEGLDQGLRARDSVSPFAVSNVISWRRHCLPPLLLPRLPALQPANISAAAVPAATSATPRRAVVMNFMEPPRVMWC